jgi:hypothetical protein
MVPGSLTENKNRKNNILTQPILNEFSNSLSQWEGTYAWGTKEEPKKEAVSLSVACSLIYGMESVVSEATGMRLYDDAVQLLCSDIEPISHRRPFFGKVVSSEVRKALNMNKSNPSVPLAEVIQQEIIKDSQLKITLEPMKKSSFILELSPKINSSGDNDLVIGKKKDNFLTVEYLFPDEKVPVSEMSEQYCLEHSKAIPIKYHTSASVIEVSPFILDFGICRVSDTYSYSIHVHNCSPVTTTILPSFQKGANELEISKFSLLPYESKDIPFFFFPVLENPEYRNKLILKNMENESNTLSIDLSAQIIDSKILNLHCNFYKLFDNVSRVQGQLSLSKGIYNIPNIGLFKIRNVWNYDITLRLILRKESQLKIIDVSSFSKSSSVTFLEGKDTPSNSMKVFAAQDQSDKFSTASRAHEVEDLRWGEHKLKHSQSLRLSLGEDGMPRLPAREKSTIISKDVDALDLLSVPVTRPPRPHSIDLGLKDLQSLSSQLPSPSVAADENKAAVLASQSPSEISKTEEEKNYLIKLANFLNSYIMQWIFFDETEKEVQIDSEDSPGSLKKNDFLQGQQLTSTIKKVQEAYKILQNIFDSECANASSDSSADGSIQTKEVLVKKGETVDLAVLWEPKLPEKGVDNIFLGRQYIKDWFQIKITHFIPPNLNLSVDELFASHPDLSSEHAKSLLEPRFVFIREECVLSEMSVIQQVVNYGKVVVGDSASKTITIVNKSSVACLYSFTKSGSITSGFLTIVQGRKGYIEPFSTKNLEIIFKPTMPCLFEEVLQIRNLLNPKEIQYVPVKARVVRAETFNIQLLHEGLNSEFALSKIYDSYEEEMIINVYKKLLSHVSKEIRQGTKELDKDINTSGKQPPSISHPDVNSQPSSSAISNLSVFKGFGIVGKSPCLTMKFKIKNTTGKKRQFIIDGTREDSIEFLTLNRFRNDPDIVKEFTPDELETLKNLMENGKQFLAFEDIVQNILITRCQFYSETIQPANAAEEDEIRLLMDQLEKFQQKLKINTRKKKQEKIAKYQKKINEIIAKLSGNKSDEPQISREMSETKIEKKEEVEIKPVEIAPMNPTVNEHKEVIYSELVHHVSLAPDEEKLITVKISYFSGVHFAIWPKTLPFLGRIRVYETKNEDFVRSIFFGLLLFSSNRSYENYLNPVEELKDVVSADIMEKNQLNSIIAAHLKQPFTVVVPPLYIYPTKEVQPKYKKFPVNTLGVCIKLLKASKDRVLTGKFTCDATEINDGTLKIILDENFTNSIILGDYQAFTPKKYGQLHLVAEETISENLDNFFEISGKDPYELNCARSPRQEFSLVWTPNSNVLSSQEEIRIFGVLNFSYYHDLLPEPKQFLVPFICAYQHKSTIKVEKYVIFENVHVGSYSTSQVAIKNESSTEELCYTLSFEADYHEKPSSAKTGSIDILSGKTGVIPPSGEKNISLIFHASSIGRFEQRAWIQNSKDLFDQKRFIIQANVVLLQTKFIKLPDLEMKDSNSIRYKSIDFGLIQFRSEKQLSKLPQHISERILAASRATPYELKIANVSQDPLLVSLQPNLKNQCFIYEDKSCLILKKQFLIPKKETLSVYILLKPTDIEKSKLGGSSSSLSNVEKSEVREVNGGIRLIIEQETVAAEKPPPMDQKPNETNGSNSELVKLPDQPIHKLFEIALSLQAQVGKSVFTVKNTTSGSINSNGKTNEVMRVSYGSSSNSANSPDLIFTQFSGELEISNLSKVFPLQYQIYDENHTVVFCKGSEPSDESNENCLSVIHAHQKKYHYLSTAFENDIILLLSCEDIGNLNPQQSEKIKFTVILKNSSTFGLFCKTLYFYNSSTNDMAMLDLSFYVEIPKISCQFFRSEMHNNQLQEPPSNFGIVVEEKKEQSTVYVPEFALSERIWIKPISTSKQASNYQNLQSDMFIHNIMNSDDVSIIEKAFIDKIIRFDVAASSDALLGTVTITNLTSKFISLQPMSELPIYVMLENPNALQRMGSFSSHEMKSVTFSHSQLSKKGKEFFEPIHSNTASSTASEAGNTISSPVAPDSAIFEFGSKRRRMKKCGTPFTLKPNSEVKVYLKISVKEIERALFSESQLRSILLGKSIHVGGLLCFVENVTKLQSMFTPPTMVPNTTNPASNSSNPTPITKAKSGDGNEHNSFPVETPKSDFTADVVSPSLNALYVCKLESEITYPRITMDCLQYDFGNIRWNKKKTFTSTMKNFSFSEVLCSIEPLPEWLTVEIKKAALEDYPSTSSSSLNSLNNLENKFEIVKPDERTMTNYEVPDHNNERFIFFPVAARSVYIFTYQIGLAGKLPENIASNIRHSLLYRFFSVSSEHSVSHDTNTAMTSLSFSAYNNFQMEICFNIDNKSMLDVAVTAPTILHPLSRTIPSTVGDSPFPKSFALVNRLECIFNEYFLVPAPTRIDFSTMNTLIDRFRELQYITDEDAYHHKTILIPKLPNDLMKKFYFLNQNYTFWLKNNTKEKIEVNIEFIPSDVLSSELTITYKVEDSSSANSGLGALNPENMVATPTTLGGNDHPTTKHQQDTTTTASTTNTNLRSNLKKIVLNVGESISLIVKILAKSSSRWDEFKLETIQKHFPVNDELSSSVHKTEYPAGFEEEYERKHCNALQSIIYRLRKFRMGPCLFGTLRFVTSPHKMKYISPSPSIGSDLFLSEKSAKIGSAIAGSTTEEDDETRELLDIELKGTLSFGSTIYLLPYHRFCSMPSQTSIAIQSTAPKHGHPPSKAMSLDDSSHPPLPPGFSSVANPTIPNYNMGRTSPSTSSIFSKSNTPHHEGHSSLSPVMMYQDKKGYWNLTFPGVKKMSVDSALNTEPSLAHLPKFNFELSTKECSFYLVNNSSETLHFCTSNYNIRYPGLFLQVKEKFYNDLGKEEEFIYSCDTINATLQPSEGFVPPNSAMLVKVVLQPTCSSDAIIYEPEELSNRYFREEYQRLVNSFQSHHGFMSATPMSGGLSPEGGSLAVSESHRDGKRPPAPPTPELNKHLLFTLPFYIWDKNWLLHPPISLHLNITSNEDIPMIISSPISITNRSKQSMDLVHLNKVTTPQSQTPIPGVNTETPQLHGATRLVRQNSIEPDARFGLMENFPGGIIRKPDVEDNGQSRRESISIISSTSFEPSTLELSKKLPIPDISGQMFSTKGTTEVLAEISNLLSEYEENSANNNRLFNFERSNSLFTPTSPDSPFVTEISGGSHDEDFEELQGLKLLSSGGEDNLSGKRKNILNMRGMTPYTFPNPNDEPFALSASNSTANSTRYGIVDLGKQTIKNERLEWMLTIENQSKHHFLKFEVDEYSMQQYSTLSTVSMVAVKEVNLESANNRARSVSGNNGEVTQTSVPPSPKVDTLDNTVHEGCGGGGGLDSWLVLGRNAGIIPPLQSISIMLYFDRSQPGKYLSYISIRSTSILLATRLSKRNTVAAITARKENYCLKTMSEVIPAEKLRRPSVTNAPPFPLMENQRSVTDVNLQWNRELSSSSYYTWKSLTMKWFSQFFFCWIDNKRLTKNDDLTLSNDYYNFMNSPLPIMPYYGAVEDEFTFTKVIFTEDEEQEQDEDSNRKDTESKKEPEKVEKSLNPVKNQTMISFQTITAMDFEIIFHILSPTNNSSSDNSSSSNTPSHRNYSINFLPVSSSDHPDSSIQIEGNKLIMKLSGGVKSSFLLELTGDVHSSLPSLLDKKESFHSLGELNCRIPWMDSLDYSIPIYFFTPSQETPQKSQKN